MLKKNAKNSSLGSEIIDENKKDGLYILKALCQLSKPKNQTAGDSLELKSRILSLQLIDGIIENYYTIFKKSEFFMSNMRQHLFNALIKNLTSSSPTILTFALSIFYKLSTYMRDYFKVCFIFFYVRSSD